MTSVYNLLREACGISQAEAADYIHQSKLDTIKSWSSDRRPAPGWAINQLQALVREIRQSGEDYAVKIMQMNNENVFVIGLPHDDEDARRCGFPSSAAHHQAVATAIALLPDDAEIRVTPRVADYIPAPLLQKQPPRASRTDRQVFMSTMFSGGRFMPPRNSNMRKYERLETLGWIKSAINPKGRIEYMLTHEGKEIHKLKPGDQFRLIDEKSGARQLMKVVEFNKSKVTPEVKRSISIVSVDDPSPGPVEIQEASLRRQWRPE